MRLAPLLLLCACAHERHVLTPPDEIDDPAARLTIRPVDLDGYQAAFRLTWNGERIGEARESFRRDGAGWRFERNEHVAVRRGGKVANARTRVVIDTDARLLARRVMVERWVRARRCRWNRRDRHQNQGAALL